MSEVEGLSARVIEVLGERGLWLATAESLTGGLLGATVTAVPGASRVYLGGVVTYDTAMKARLAGVRTEVLDAMGPVAEQTVAEMALGVQTLTGADWALAVTGVAGPGPQDGHQPGEVWIAVVGPQIGAQRSAAPMSRRIDLSGDRGQIREQCVRAALELLLQVMSPV